MKKKHITKLYSIKPLKWRCVSNETEQRYSVWVRGGVYHVHRNKPAFIPEKPWGPWNLTIHFQTSLTAMNFGRLVECRSLAHGKQLAWEDWLTRILPELEEWR